MCIWKLRLCLTVSLGWLQLLIRLILFLSQPKNEFHISLPYPPQSTVVVYATTSVPHEAVVAYPSLLFFNDANYNETQLIRVEGRDDGDAYDDDLTSEVEIGIC